MSILFLQFSFLKDFLEIVCKPKTRKDQNFIIRHNSVKWLKSKRLKLCKFWLYYFPSWNLLQFLSISNLFQSLIQLLSSKVTCRGFFYAFISNYDDADMVTLT